jgi:hypothetical protein
VKPGRRSWKRLAVVLCAGAAGCAGLYPTTGVAVYGRWGNEGFEGVASIPSDRVTAFEVHSLERPDAACRVKVRIGAMGMGDGTAVCDPGGVSVPVQVFYDELAGSITLMIGAGPT